MGRNPQVSLGEDRQNHEHTWMKVRQGHWVCTAFWCEAQAACPDCCPPNRFPRKRERYLLYCDIHHA